MKAIHLQFFQLHECFLHKHGFKAPNYAEKQL